MSWSLLQDQCTINGLSGHLFMKLHSKLSEMQQKKWLDSDTVGYSAMSILWIILSVIHI